MKSLRWSVVVCAVAVVTGALSAACSRHYVVVPQQENGYAETDTLYGRLNGDEIRVTFWFDTIVRIDTVVEVDTIWQKGSRTVLRIDTVAVHDTVLRVDTVRVPTTGSVRVDTVRVSTTETVVDTVVRIDTVRVPVTETLVRTDTVRLFVTDTVRVVHTDTVRLVRTDTVRVAGQRMLFVPPGHYPPRGQCRVWIHDLAPGRQAAAAPCTGLGTVPAGAFILFAGEAWDFDYDWLGEAAAHPGKVPPEILALKRKG